MTMPLLAQMYIISMVCGLGFLICGGILLIFRKSVGYTLKLKKFIKHGYVICELVRHDKTRVRTVVIPKINTVKFPHCEGIYNLDNASVTLLDRKYPIYTWVEGETSPVNFGSETMDTIVTCPICTEKITCKVEKQKSIAPEVLENVILKIKSINAMDANAKLLMLMLIGIGALIVIGVGGFSLIYKQLPEKLAPIILEQCKLAITQIATGATVVPK